MHMTPSPTRSTLFPYTTLFRSEIPYGHWGLARAYMDSGDLPKARQSMERVGAQHRSNYQGRLNWALLLALQGDRKSTRLNSSHANRSYAVFCLKKKRYH